MTADALLTRVAVALHGVTPPDPEGALALHRDAAARVVAALGDEAGRLRAAVAVEHNITLAPEWGVGRNVPVCMRCTYGDGVSFRWPCPTLQQIGYPPPPELRETDMRHAVDAIRVALTTEPTP